MGSPTVGSILRHQIKDPRIDLFSKTETDHWAFVYSSSFSCHLEESMLQLTSNEANREVKFYHTVTEGSQDHSGTA